jgi:hypothetical protein
VFGGISDGISDGICETTADGGLDEFVSTLDEAIVGSP